MSVTVKMGNAKNEFELYSDLGDSKKKIEIKERSRSSFALLVKFSCDFEPLVEITN